ncbi:MAG: acyl-CoA thioesterase [Nevskia sp.]|nr:acyl-CoA thioesterase [Nevskia sp.]
MKRSVEVEILVPFHDVDVVGIVWHGHYAKYFEIARCALLDSFDYNYDRMRASGYLWPLIDMRMRYIKPSLFGQKVRVRATLVEWESCLRIEYLVRDDATGVRLTKGESVQVAVRIGTNEMCPVSPDILFERLGMPKPS